MEKPSSPKKAQSVTSDDVAFVIGGGPSLKGFDFQRLRGRPCFAANKSAFFTPWGELVSIDRDFCFHFTAEIDAFGQRAHLAPTDNLKHKNPAARYYGRDRKATITDCPDDCLPGMNSGYAALALAVRRGYRKIGILGVDMIANGGHFHSGYSWSPNQIDGIIGAWIDQFDRAGALCREKGIIAVNFSLSSAVTGFPKRPLDDLFCDTFEERIFNDDVYL